MYADKRLAGPRWCMQSLSWLNRICPGTEEISVLDFAMRSTAPS